MATRPSRDRRALLRFRALVRGWPFYYESRRISTREVLLRAIPKDASYVKEDMGGWKVSPFAFKPHKKRDMDGMSFFREDFATPKMIADTNRHPNGVRMARITVRQLRELGLDAEPSPSPEYPPGHAIVRGMKYVERTLLSEDARHKIEDLSQRLAQLATQNGLVE